jgi:hypothetical protein
MFFPVAGQVSVADVGLVNHLPIFTCPFGVGRARSQRDRSRYSCQPANRLNTIRRE